MRAYEITVKYMARGNRYPRAFTTRLMASSIGTASQRALAQCKKEPDFREVAEGDVTVHIRIGDTYKGRAYKHIWGGDNAGHE